MGRVFFRGELPPVTLVVDASVLVAALIDTGPDGTWADAVLGSDPGRAVGGAEEA